MKTYDDRGGLTVKHVYTVYLSVEVKIDAGNFIDAENLVKSWVEQTLESVASETGPRLQVVDVVESDREI